MAHIPIQVSKVTKRFGDVQALDGVDLTVASGEMLGLIGHNGSGKSTLFKLMLGLLPACTGSIQLFGTPLRGADFRLARQRIGYLPEQFVTYDNLTGLEALHLFADLKRVRRSECQPVLERVGLGDAARRRVKGYSKGMRQRLGFAQVLLGNPQLIFLDEPTNGLDAEGIHEFYGILREVQAQGATIVITSHILAEIQERVDRLMILSGGRVAAHGTLAELRAKMDLPSTIEVSMASGADHALIATLSAMPDIRYSTGNGRISVVAGAAQKVPVLQVLAMQLGVCDIVVREPSLEDVFLGYGGKGE